MGNQLDQQQKQCVNHTNGSALVIAGPGSGKTRIIVNRYIKLSEEGITPLCLTFANGANYQIINRVKSQKPNLLLNIYSFHGFAYKMLNYYNICNYNIISEQQQSILGHQLSIDIDAINKYHCSPFGYNNHLEQMLLIYYDYCAKNKIIDFSYLLFYFKNHLEQQKDFRTCLQKSYQEIIVDEFQDINYIQKEILRLLSNDNLFCVGDDDQAIYGWRGSNINYMVNFYNYFGSHSKYYLTNNYRSSGNVVEFTNYIISHNKNRFNKTIITTKAPGSLVQILNSSQEFFIIAQTILKIIQNNPQATIGILVRKGSWINMISYYLSKNKINFSTKISPNKKHFKIILSYLHFITNPSLFTLKQIIQEESINIGQVTLKKLETYTNIIEGLKSCKKYKLINLYERAINMNQKEQFEYIINNSSISNQTNFSEQMVQNLWQQWKKYDFAYNHLLEDINICDNLPQVLLITIHKSKGLEFDHVFVVGLEEGEFPVANCRDFEEERRIFYVGCTRAIKQLYITYGGFANNPSRYITHVPNLITKLVVC